MPEPQPMRPSSTDVLKQFVESLQFVGYTRTTVMDGEDFVDTVYRDDGTVALTARVRYHPRTETT